MTAKELQKRNAKAENLRVLQTEDGSYYVESAEGKILYNVSLNDGDTGCTCGDYVKNIRQDANFRCKHNHDINDAFAVLWTAERIFRGDAKVLPADNEFDSVGLRMGIWY